MAEPTATQDAWQEEATQMLQPPAPASQTPVTQPAASSQQTPQQTVPQDAWQEEASKDHPTNSIAEATKSWWDWANDSLLVPKGSWEDKQLAKENEIGQQIINHEISSGHPWRAALAQFYYGAMKDSGEVVKQLTTPTNLTLLATQASKLRAAKAVLTAANLYFVSRAGESLLTERQAQETQADYTQRILFSLSGLAAGTGGAASEAGQFGELTRQNIQTKLGLSGDLADKVTQKVQQVHALRQQGATEAAGEALKGIQEGSDILDQAAAEQRDARGVLQNVQTEVPIRMGQLVRDAAHAVYSEGARVSKLFEDMGSKAEAPLSDAPTIRSTIIDVMKDHGVQDHEIPPKVFAALPKFGKSSGDFLDVPRGPVAESIPELNAGLQEIRKPVSFNDLTRVRGDLYDAAQSASDAVVKNGLFDAYDSMTKMQEDYARSEGFGDQYANAKQQYKQFKRELGSGLMADFLKAEDYKQQAMTPKLAKIMGGQDMEAIRGLLKMAGVDVSPLDELAAQKKGAVETLRGSQKAADKAAAAALRKGESAATKKLAETEKEARALGKAQPVIPKTNDLDLEGKTTEEIRKIAIERLATNARTAGISNGMGLFMLIYGSIRLGMGSPFGVYAAGRGGQATLKNYGAKLLKNPSYQDWIIREAGADPSNAGLIGKLRKGLTALANTASKMSKAPEPPEDQQ